MAQLISFSTGKFDISKETPNPINPIFGEGVLNWLRGKLDGTAYKATQPEAEDWGWYMSVEGNGSTYMVGASGEPERPAPDIDWILQVHKSRTLKDKFTGRNRMEPDDPLVALIESVVRSEPDFRDISVASDA